MVDIALLMGANRGTVTEEMKKVLEFETMLANVSLKLFAILLGGGQVVPWCWVNFQCRCVLLIRGQLFKASLA